MELAGGALRDVGCYCTDLSLNNENQNGGTSNGGESNKGTPGFELVLVLTALFIGIIYYKRKR